MNISRKVFLCGLAAAGLAAGLLTGCEKQMESAWTPDRTAVQISKDGTVTETVIDTLDQSYYSADELTSMVESAISDYQAEHGDGSVSETSIQIEDGQVTLVLAYASADDYRDFNNITFFNGSMLNAEMEGYEFNQSFIRIEDSKAGETIDNTEPLSHKEYQVTVADLSHAVQVPGKITYISSNAQLIDAYTAEPVSGTVAAAVSSSAQESQSGDMSAGSVTEAGDTSAAADGGDGLFYIIYDF